MVGGCKGGITAQSLNIYKLYSFFLILFSFCVHLWIFVAKFRKITVDQRGCRGFLTSFGPKTYMQQHDGWALMSSLCIYASLCSSGVCSICTPRTVTKLSVTQLLTMGSW